MTLVNRLKEFSRQTTGDYSVSNWCIHPNLSGNCFGSETVNGDATLINKYRPPRSTAGI
ncbi:hypothetical protein SP41_30 [Salmonella phage 41]|nr:hypothetical protein SP41_30 [Salmonella phage 41]